MVEETKDEDKSNVPKLDDKNFLQWRMRMLMYLKAKDYYKYVTDPNYNNSNTDDEEESAVTAELTGNQTRTSASFTRFTPAIKKGLKETSHLIASKLGTKAFNQIVTEENMEVPYLIWNKIMAVYASKSINNKARVYLQYTRYRYKGTLSDFINDIQELLHEFAAVNIKMPADILSYDILGKLPESMYQLVDSMLENESLFKDPSLDLNKLQERVFHVKS